MDYEAIDRDMSSWTVSCVKRGTRFYLTDTGVATDILSRANRWRWRDEAGVAADFARQERAWSGFRWRAFSVAQAMGETRRAVPGLRG